MSRKVLFDFYNVLYDREKRGVSTDVLSVVMDLKKKGVDLYLFTNSRECFLKENDTVTPFLKYFTKVVSCDGCRKPSKESFEKLLETVGGKYEDMFLVDDSDTNIQEARKFGIHGTQYIDADTLREVFGV